MRLLERDIAMMGSGMLGHAVLLFTVTTLLARQIVAPLPMPWNVEEQAQRDGNPMAPILALEAMAADYLSSPMRSSYLEALGTLYSYTGQYRQALECFDRLKSDRGEHAASLPTSGNLDGLQSEDALAAIRRIAASHQVLFINEAHHVPQHRAFSIQVLHELYALGFRYFAAETLSDFDKDLASRGFPLRSITGFYTVEPLYGELVRTALRLGFTVVPYEVADSKCEERPAQPWYCQNLRERGQAENLRKRILETDPQAKILVHAGYGHISKEGQASAQAADISGDKWVPMGVYFKEITGIDPFAIDQVGMTEHSKDDMEQSDYAAIVKKFTLSQPAVLRSRDAGLWVQPWLRRSYDLQVIHPRSRYRRGRPGWVTLGGARKLTPIPRTLLTGSKPCLIQAFYLNESEEAVPADQVLLMDGKSTDLALPKGEFRVRVLEPNGKVRLQRSLRVQ